MTFPLGRFGDSRVEPDELFDASDPAVRPPRDAIDVQFRVPVTLNMLLHMMDETGNGEMVDVWQAMYAEIAAGTRRFVQRPARGLDVERSGLAPARLAITTVIHDQVEGFDLPRWHMHAYVGATATSLLDGRPIPVHLESLSSSTRGIAHPFYSGKLEELTNMEWGLQWGQPGEWKVRELVEPDVARLVDNRDLGVCSLPDFRVSDVVLPDAKGLEFAARSEAVAAKARAEGRPPQPRPWRAELRERDEDLTART